MEKISSAEFNTFYEQKIKPILAPFEQRRQIVNKISAGILICSIIVIAIGVVLKFLWESGAAIACAIGIAGFLMFVLAMIQKSFGKSLKAKVTGKILLLFGNLYFSNSKNAIPSNIVKNAGLFPLFEQKVDDDIVIGLYKGCNFIINEASLSHSESVGSGEQYHRVQVSDFKGLIVKIQMKKNFTGRTIVGMKDNIKKMKGFEDVELESVSFMKERKVYSTDQIEARYILTTSFMERLESLEQVFSSQFAGGSNLSSQNEQVVRNVAQIADVMANGFSITNRMNKISGVSACFEDGFVYLFIPSNKDFFEVDTSVSLFDSKQFYNIYSEMNAILGIIDYMKLDKNLGL